MEIRQFDEVYGVVPNADIVEGRMVCMAAHTFSYDFGSRTDLPGVNVPATAEAAKNARFIITWAVDNRTPPYYTPQPAYNWALRAGGWDQTANLPMTSTTVRMTYPGYQNCETIPSGVPSLAFGEGIYTLLSGCYIDHASIGVIGSLLQVANTAEDTSSAGKPKYLSAYSDRKVATVVGYSATTGELTFHIRP
jgi:hypothetical protein